MGVSPVTHRIVSSGSGFTRTFPANSLTGLALSTS
jgi:hypothetical protein